MPKHTSSESIEHPIVTMGIPRKTYIKCSQIHNSIQSDNSETSKVKLNSSQEGRGGKTPYDPTIITKLALHQDRAKPRTRERERERERERDQTHSYWYIPSAPRVNCSLLVMESAGMMKMATGDGFPSGRVPEQGPDWFLVATEACSDRTPDLLLSLMFLWYTDL